MAKRKEITASFYIGDKKVDKLPEDYLDWMAERLGKTMSLYYAQHPEEYRAFLASEAEAEAAAAAGGT